MLEFFRKYQRSFFIVIAVVIVVSFSFFGTHQAVNKPQKEVDHLVGYAVDGSKMMRSDIDSMVRFLSTDALDTSLLEAGSVPNFFNNGVVRNDFLKNGLGTLLVQEYFDELQEELTERMSKHQQFRPYVHPYAPFISVEGLWEQVSPMQKINLGKFLTETEEINMGAFELLVDLYLGEMALPPRVLRDYLMFQQKHYQWIQPDPQLAHANLNLFHCRTTEDWFGPRFLELVAQFVTNSAALAKQKGYRVSTAEARVDLLRNGLEGLQLQNGKGQISSEEVESMWREQLLRLGLDERSAVKLWQKVMLFRRMFEDVGLAVFMDPHMYQNFHNFASKTVEVDLYRLPDHLQLKDFSSLMELELYIDAVSAAKSNTSEVPTAFAAVNEVEQQFPELVEQRFLVEVSEVQKENVALNVSLKDMWAWQLEAENFQKLEIQFPALAVKQASNSDAFFEALESLDTETRQKVDRFSRMQIVDLHPDWLQHALDHAHLNVRVLSFSADGRYLPFEGLSSGDKLLDLFKHAALKQEIEVDDHALAARKQLEMFTSDGETYYRFHLLERDVNKTLLTYAEAKERGILSDLLHKRLQDAYERIREKKPQSFRDASNNWKPLSEVLNHVGQLVYEEHLKQIEQDIQYWGVELPTEKQKDLDLFYPQYRLYGHVCQARKDIRSQKDDSTFLNHHPPTGGHKTLLPKPPLSHQWGLVKETQVVKNHEKNDWFTTDIFSMIEQSWSSVRLSALDRLSFFQIKKKSTPNGNFCSEMKEGQALLSVEAKKAFMEEVLMQLKEHNAMCLDVGT